MRYFIHYHRFVQSIPLDREKRLMSFLASLRSLFGLGLVAMSCAHAVRVSGAQRAEAQGEGEHMRMTALRPTQPGDRERADAIAARARKFMDQYTDYRSAIASGYEIIFPGVRQKIYHFMRRDALRANMVYFNPDRPTALLYVKLASPGPRYKLVGVMYGAPYGVSEDELNQRIPLSVAQWHLHINFCVPPAGTKIDFLAPNAKFGFHGSIVTEDACHAAGGTFAPQMFGWMVHIYAYESDPARRWRAGAGDEDGMQHDIMLPGMEM
jgi:hypothetical protein